ncbi:MAG: TonB-dependent receptor domain-containing protein [Acidobacteriota bacterium]
MFTKTQIDCWFSTFVAGVVALMLISPVLAGSLSGKVRDEQGKPLVGIHLQLQGQGRTLSGTTDESGGYQFEDLPGGSYRLFVRELGFESRSDDVAVETSGELTHDLILRLELLKQTVVVTATRNEASASLLGNSVTVISEDEIEAAQTLSEVLRSVAGVHLLQTGAPGSVTSLYVRGGESDYSKVLLDGIPLNQPGGYAELSNLTTAGIERIEVVRGPQSALYGSDAITGVVQMFTRKPDEEVNRPQLELSLETGSYSQLGASGGVHGRQNRFSYSGLFSHWETDNAVPNSFLNDNSFSSTLGVELSETASLTLLGRGDYGRAGVPGAVLFGPPDLEESYRKRNSVFGAAFNQRLTSSATHRLSYSQAQINELSEDLVDSGSFTPSYRGRTAGFPSFDYLYSFLNATRRQVAGYQADFTAFSHILTAGLEYEDERGTVGDVRASRRNYGTYIQDQLVAGRRLSLTGGVRLDHNGSFGFAATPRFSLAWLLRAGREAGFWGMTRPKFNFGLGIKEPSLLESFSTNPYYRGNPDLKPERTRSLETGIEQRLAGNRVRFELNGFYNYFRNQIDLLTTDFNTFEASYFNIGRSQAWGIEQLIELRPEQPWRLSGGYTYLNTRILESAAPFHSVLRAGSRLLRRPTHSGFLTGGWYRPGWSLAARAVFVGNRTDNDFYGLNLREVEGYSRVDVNGSIRISRRAEFYAVIHNLLNAEYSEALGYPALKLNFRSGLRFRF